MYKRNTLVVLLAPIAFLFFNACSENEKAGNNESQVVSERLELPAHKNTEAISADTLIVRADLLNTGYAHGWGYIFRCKTLDFLKGSLKQKEINKLDLNINFYDKWSFVLPKSSDEPLRVEIVFRNLYTKESYNAGYNGFIDDDGKLWEIVSFTWEPTPYTRMNGFINELLTEYDTLRKNDLLVPLDTTGVKSFIKVSFKKRETVSYGDVKGIYPEFTIWDLQYKDRNHKDSALNNLLKGFASDIGNNKTIAIGQYEKSVKSPPIYAVITHTGITLLKHPCEHAENNWQPVKDMITKQFSEDSYVVMEIGCGGPLNWINKP